MVQFIVEEWADRWAARRSQTLSTGVFASDQNLLTRLGCEMLKRFRDGGHWGEVTLYDLALHHAEATPDKPALSDGTCTLTYAQLVSLADAISVEFVRAGLRPGDRVAAWLSNRVELGPLLLACSRNGMVFCPSLHRTQTAHEIAVLSSRLRAKAIISEDGFGAGGDLSDAIRPQSHVALHYRLAPPQPRGALQIAEAFPLSNRAPGAPAGRSDHIVYLAFTSGTSGDPKGVLHSNNTLLANARAMAAAWRFDAESVIYSLSPLSHNLGFGALVLSLLCGGTQVLHHGGMRGKLTERLRETRATFLFGVPAHAMDLVAEIESGSAKGLEALRGFRISGAAVPESTVRKLLSHRIIAQAGYGMTEGCSHHFTLPDDPPDRIVNTSGRACVGYEVQIFATDDPDRALPPGEIGQVGGRGASLMLGYFDDQAATESAFNRDGWFMTGDLGVLDDDGYLRIVGRIKEIIIRGGHNIHPANIERLAMRHPRVERAAAVPVPDERLGEKVCLVVTAVGTTKIEPADLLAHLDTEGLSKFDMPEYFLQVEEIPSSSNGKMLKRHLVASIASGELAPIPVSWKG
jgi:acyl-CoA synthetase (AMP-forming)/AMP-acid ligase II